MVYRLPVRLSYVYSALQETNQNQSLMTGAWTEQHERNLVDSLDIVSCEFLFIYISFDDNIIKRFCMTWNQKEWIKRQAWRRAHCKWWLNVTTLGRLKHSKQNKWLFWGYSTLQLSIESNYITVMVKYLVSKKLCCCLAGGVKQNKMISSTEHGKVIFQWRFKSWHLVLRAVLDLGLLCLPFWLAEKSRSVFSTQTETGNDFVIRWNIQQRFFHQSE